VILAGDLGGTNARLALYDATGRRRIVEKTYASREFRSAGDVLARFLREHGERAGAAPRRASLGIAGPVDGHRCVATNLPWVVDARALARRFGFERVALHNDMIALAHGCVAASPRHREVLHGARAPSLKKGVVAVVAPGTGLGECYLVPSAAGVVSMPTEGGHADFSPRDAEECALLAFAQKTHGRVSTERILCGDGLGLVHRFVVDELGLRDREKAASIADPNKRVMALAEAKSPAARRAVRLFAGLLGAELGNVALRGLARGGVFLSGGLGAAVVRLEGARVVEAFRAKGRFRSLLESVPLALVARTDIGLDGSAALACIER
jgi:glucokinase